MALAMVLMGTEPGTLSDAPPPIAGADAAGEIHVTSVVGARAPLHFVLKDLRGVDVRLDSFKGKVILLNFWATWCGPCRAEVPDLISLHQTYPDNVVVLGVVVMDRFGDNVKRFASELKINDPVLDGTARQDVEDAYGPMWGLPTTIVIGRDGTIAKRHSGIGSREQFEREVKALL